MPRRYDVYIEGRPLVIAEAVPDPVPEQWVVLRIDVPEEVDRAVAVFIATPAMHGMVLHGLPVSALWSRFRHGYEPVQAAGGAVTDEHGRLLVIRRLGKWDLPKGKVDTGEGIPEAALREVTEECGLQHLRIVGELPCTWHTYERKGRQHLKRTDWYLMRASSGETLTPQLEEDIQEVRWMRAEELPTMKADTYPSLMPVVLAWEADRHKAVNRPTP
jgi:ADP-ribose pyrophosphatase YjhB (NUDIX family)